jgi:large subunit ribosomal protein L21
MTTRTDTHNYAIISLGGKQYVVHEGEHLLVDRLGTEEGKTFHPDILFLGDGGKGELAPKNATVTAKVVGHVLGDKIRIGKYRPKKGYKRHTGFRARLSRIEIESIAAAKRTSAAKAEPAPAKQEAAPAKQKAVPAKEEAVPAKQEAVSTPPSGYADLTVVQIAEQVKGWKPEQIEAALEYERAHAKRKGALAALGATKEKEG